ncbi:MAG: thioesterase [Eubacteriales bacterium]|nr:thioesterase [Eubacteriales bacterium]
MTHQKMAHHTINIDVNPEDFDESGKIIADRVFRFFQDTSESHVNELGISPDELIKRNYIWVLTKMRIRYTGEMKAGEKYICTTYLVRHKRASFKRDYYINYASDGAVPEKAVVIGASQWCVMNYKTRKLEKTDTVFSVPEDGVDMIEGIFPKIHGENPQHVMDHTVGADDLDKNDHCNNIRYIALSEEATGRNVDKALYVNFAKETRFGEKISIYTEEREDGTYVEGRIADGTIVYQLIIC